MSSFLAMHLGGGSPCLHGCEGTTSQICGSVVQQFERSKRQATIDIGSINTAISNETAPFWLTVNLIDSDSVMICMIYIYIYRAMTLI